MVKPERSYELTATWNGAEVSVAVRARSKPSVRADKLADLLDSPVQLWLVRDGMRMLIYETSK